MKKIMLTVILLFIVGAVMAEDISSDTSVVDTSELASLQVDSTDTIAIDTTRLVHFRRSIYKEGWDIKYVKLWQQLIYMRPYKLSKHEARAILMPDSPELLLFEEGRRRRILGNALLGVGIPLTVSVIGSPLGGPMMMTGVYYRAKVENMYMPNVVELHNQRINRPSAFGEELRNYRSLQKTIKYRNIAIMSFCASGVILAPGIYYLTANNQADNRLIGVFFAANSLGLAVTGTMFFRASNIYLTKVFESQNSNIALDFGLTNNGLGLTATF